ncbi:His/Gly/Thr/Pro-type tRNA ligase C-terminal domain-containing protein [Dubosiella newyorkensis]
MIGIPYRITIGKGIKSGLVEWVDRATKQKEEISLEDAKTRIQQLYQ